MTVTVRYWAAARDAAATAAESVDDVATLAALLDAVLVRHGGADGPLARVIAVASFLVDDVPVGRRSPAAVTLHDGAVVEVLPPFAGG